MRKPVVVLLFVAGAFLASPPAEAQVSVNVSIGPPPVIFSAPPRVVIVPQPRVYDAPDTSYNVFRYEGRYDSFHDGSWFFATSHAGPWAFVPVEHVPRAVVMVPPRYYKVPPGHAKRIAREEHHHGHGHGHGPDHCPPGHAKKGRC